MNRALTKGDTPEERELNEKRARLAALETLLAERELELHTLLASLRRFELRYIETIGRKRALARSALPAS